MRRRQFITQTGLSLAFVGFCRNSGIASALLNPAYNMKPLRNGVGIFTEQGGTIGWLVNPDGIVVVDSQFPEPAAHLLSELKNQSQQPVSYLINTHHHGDHTGGNIAFKGIAGHVVAHVNSAANQKRVTAGKEDRQLYPDKVFDKEWSSKIGGNEITCRYFGAGHTDGDAIIHFDDANIVHMGDLVFNKRFPFIDRSSGASISNWIMVLDKTLKTFDNDTLYIFGHALDPEKVTGGKDDVKAMRNFLDKLLNYVSGEIKKGKTKEEIIKATSIPGAEDFAGQGIERGLTAAYDELTA